MKKEARQKFFKGFIYFTWAFLLFTAIYSLFNNIYISLYSAIYLSLLLFAYFKLEKIPLQTHFMASLFFIFVIFGETYLSLYYDSGCSSISIPAYYDKLIHFFGVIVLSSVFYHMAERKIKDKKMLILFAVLAAFTISGLWEVYEFIFDNLFNARMQGVFSIIGDASFCGDGMLVVKAGSSAVVVMDALTDTILDLILATIGGITYYFSSIYYFERKYLKHKK